MGRRKKLALPDELPIEIIIWDDHSSGDNEALDDDTPQWATIGARVSEDDKSVTIVCSILKNESEDLNTGKQLTWAKILKATIVERKVIGTAPNPFEPAKE